MENNVHNTVKGKKESFMLSHDMYTPKIVLKSHVCHIFVPLVTDYWIRLESLGKGKVTFAVICICYDELRIWNTFHKRATRLLK